MKSKAPLTLLELMLMLLVFALAAAVCLRAFVLADRMVKESDIRDGACLQAQNAAETLKYTHGDYVLTAELLDGVADPALLTIYYDENWQPVSRPDTYTLRAVPARTESELLGGADIRVTDVAGKEHYALTVLWQKEESNA